MKNTESHHSRSELCKSYVNMLEATVNEKHMGHRAFKRRLKTNKVTGLESINQMVHDMLGN